MGNTPDQLMDDWDRFEWEEKNPGKQYPYPPRDTSPSGLEYTMAEEYYSVFSPKGISRPKKKSNGKKGCSKHKK
jgi:hypothetical protein